MSDPAPGQEAGGGFPSVAEPGKNLLPHLDVHQLRRGSFTSSYGAVYLHSIGFTLQALGS